MNRPPILACSFHKNGVFIYSKRLQFHFQCYSGPFDKILLVEIWSVTFAVNNLVFHETTCRLFAKNHNDIRVVDERKWEFVPSPNLHSKAACSIEKKGTHLVEVWYFFIIRRSENDDEGLAFKRNEGLRVFEVAFHPLYAHVAPIDRRKCELRVFI